MADPYIGEIRLFAGNFNPTGFAMCNGQLMPISQNAALFSLIGTTYGGDGQTTFALPNLQGRLPVHMGTSAQGTYVQGQILGTETVTLTGAQIPSHTHTAYGTNTTAGTTSPAGALYAATTGTNDLYAAATAGTLGVMAGATLASAGGSQPHDNLMPFLCVTYIIALFGVFPSQN